MNKCGTLKFHQWNQTHIMPLTAVLFGHKIQARFADNMSTSGMYSWTLKSKEAINNKRSQALDQFIKYKCCGSSYHKAFSKLPSPPKSTPVFPYPVVYVFPHVVSPQTVVYSTFSHSSSQKNAFFVNQITTQCPWNNSNTHYLVGSMSNLHFYLCYKELVQKL